MMFSVVSGYLSKKRPFYILSCAIFIEMIITTYAILVLFRTFPPKDEISTFTTIHVVIVIASFGLTSNFVFVTFFAMCNLNADKRVAGVHYTIMASMSNFSNFIHKTYIFYVIEAFGIFYP